MTVEPGFSSSKPGSFLFVALQETTQKQKIVNWIQMMERRGEE